MELVDVLCTALSAGVLLYLLTAFLGDAPALSVDNLPADFSARSALVIRELESDFAAGKMSREDYDIVRRQTVEELAAALKTEKRKEK